MHHTMPHIQGLHDQVYHQLYNNQANFSCVGQTPHAALVCLGHYALLWCALLQTVYHHSPGIPLHNRACAHKSSSLFIIVCVV